MLVLTHKYTKLKAIHNNWLLWYLIILVGANAQIYKIESNSQRNAHSNISRMSWC